MERMYDRKRIHREKSRDDRIREDRSRDDRSRDDSNKRIKADSSKRIRDGRSMDRIGDDSKRHDARSEKNKNSGGLNVEIHPFLKDIVPIPEATKNPLKNKVRQEFDPTSINPYLDPLNMGAGVRKSRPLQLNTPGKYIEQGRQLRQKLQEQEQEQQHQKYMEQKGLIANKDLGEDLYRPEIPPSIEWWDSYYINGRNYDVIEDHSKIILNDEFAPITKYIQHPVLLSAPFEKHGPGMKPMYLTKKELKRKRKNERQEKYRIQQERIRQGLEPPPPPKVKLSNLASVLTNQAIKDPTAIENRVKREVEQRYKTHMQTNEARKLTKEAKHDKLHQKRQQDLSKGYYRHIYRIDKLVDSQHFFKVDKNAQQLELKGLCIVTENMTLILVEGGAKSLKFYDKLLMRRIDWTKSNNPSLQVDLTKNRVVKLWEGQVKELQFHKWSIIKPKTQEDLDSAIHRFDLVNTWRQAVNV